VKNKEGPENLNTRGGPKREVSGEKMTEIT